MWADLTQQSSRRTRNGTARSYASGIRRLARRYHELLDALILFRSVLLAMCLTRMLTVLASMARVPAGSVCMMRSFLVMTALVVLGCFPVMTSSMRMVFRRFAMVLGGFFGHDSSRFTAVRPERLISRTLGRVRKCQCENLVPLRRDLFAILTFRSGDMF